MALVLMIMFDAVIELQMPHGRNGTMALPLVIFVIGLVQTLLLTPYLIAVHRFIILHETTARYLFAPRAPRNQLYFLCWASFSILVVVPVFLSAVLQSAETAGGLPGALILVYFIVIMIAGLRLTTLFPAIAVDAPGAGWRKALAETRGHVWRIFLIGVLAFLPVMVVAALAQWLASTSPKLLFTLVLSILDGIVAFVTITLYGVIASRLYEALGDKAKRAA
jgi:Ca2+/H+ antiporter